MKQRLKNVLLMVLKVLAKIEGLLPMRNPIGKPQFEQFCTDVFSTYDIPDLPSYRSALAAMVLQDKRLYRSKHSFALAIRKAQANETAYQVMKEIREQEKTAAAPAQQPGAQSGPQTPQTPS
jgi:hypothetical protein